MRRTDSELFEELVKYANEQHDGHFTICKFTTNWGVGFFTPNSRDDILDLCEGETFEDAANSALNPERQ